ncbi:hypothetical protein [Thermococcus sp.]
MRRWLKLFGIVLFTIGFVLTATYDRPNCSGVACVIPEFPVLELKANSGDVFVWPPNSTPPEVIYRNGEFTFVEDYNISLNEFYVKVSDPLSFNVSKWLTIFPKENFGKYELIYANRTLRAGDVLYKRSLMGVLIKNGTKVSELVIYSNPGKYLEFKRCLEHYNETVEACKRSGSPEYQLPLGVGLMVLGLALFGMGMKF